MNIFIFDQYSEICQGEDFHTGKITNIHKSLSALEYTRAVNISQEDAKIMVKDIIKETELMGDNFSIVMQSDTYAEVCVFPQASTKLYRVIYTKS